VIPGWVAAVAFSAGLIAGAWFVLAHDWLHVKGVMRRNHSLSRANRVLHAQRDADEVRHAKEIDTFRADRAELVAQLDAARALLPGVEMGE
jgi:hypothetical protein